MDGPGEYSRRMGSSPSRAERPPCATAAGRASDGRAVAVTMLLVKVTRQRGQADHQEDRALFGQQFGARAEEVLLYGQRRLA